jgi:hypothetical protein
MKTSGRHVAALETVLILPSVLFMTAVFVRNLQPPQLEPAHTAQRIVAWYSASPGVGLWLLLISLPATVLVTGCLTLRRDWNRDADLRKASRATFEAARAHLGSLLVALASVTAALVLSVVALHALSD